MSSRSLNHGSTEIEAQAHLEAVQHFADQLKQIPVSRERVNRMERDIAKIALATLAVSGRPPSGEPIRADDGFLWHKGVELFENVFVCHREIGNLTEFAVVERFQTGTNEIWTKGRNVVEVLKAFTHDQQQALHILIGDMAIQVKEFLAEKYPGHDLTRTAENFLHRFTEAELQNCPPHQTHDSQRLRCE